MTLKEMFKKVATYNEVAEVMGNSKVAIELSDRPYNCSCRLFSAKTTSYKELAQAIRKEYIKTYADKMLRCDFYEMDRDVTIGDHTISIRLVEEV